MHGLSYNQSISYLPIIHMLPKLRRAAGLHLWPGRDAIYKGHVAPDAELVAAGHHCQLLPQGLLAHRAHLALLMQHVLCVSLIMGACDAFVFQKILRPLLLFFFKPHRSGIGQQLQC